MSGLVFLTIILNNDTKKNTKKEVLQANRKDERKYTDLLPP